MKKALYFITPVLILALMEGAAWMIWKKSSLIKETKVTEFVPEVAPQPEPKDETLAPEITTSGPANTDSESFPPPSTEVVNGRTERTIHMGVRKWAWEPSTLRAKQGELVRLVIHNADVDHPFYIPELGIEVEVPPEGAVVEFEAKKKGSFFFLCGRYCGEGHAEMQGTLIID